VKKEVEDMRPSHALEHIVNVLTMANKYLEEKAPWKMAKENLPEAGHVLATTAEVLRICGTLLTPVMPRKGKELLARIGVADSNWASLSKWPGIPEGTKMVKGEPLFPRKDFAQTVK
jgi:methionyl-tRNA synthetase